VLEGPLDISETLSQHATLFHWLNHVAQLLFNSSTRTIWYFCSFIFLQSYFSLNG